MFLRNSRRQVVPVNADAKRGALVSSYMVGKSLDDVEDELIEAGRPILDRQEQHGRLVGLVAGPMPGSTQFGITRYYPHPQLRNSSVAIGELNRFWVDADDLSYVHPARVREYAGEED